MGYGSSGFLLSLQANIGCDCDRFPLHSYQLHIDDNSATLILLGLSVGLSRHSVVNNTAASGDVLSALQPGFNHFWRYLSPHCGVFRLQCIENNTDFESVYSS
jgi:hypothetical protein